MLEGLHGKRELLCGRRKVGKGTLMAEIFGGFIVGDKKMVVGGWGRVEIGGG